MLKKIWLITGASRGVGRALVDAVRGRGHVAVAAQRRAASGPDTVFLDLTDSRSCMAAVDAVVARYGRVDVLANVAGIGMVGALEEVGESEMRVVMETNYWGPVALSKACLPHFRAQGSGHIINVSSLSGRTASAGVSAYVASKFALEGLSEALAIEAKEHGVRVSIIEPGGIRTDWVEGALAGGESVRSAYHSVQQVKRVLMESRGHQETSPSDLARIICAEAESSAGDLRVVVGNDAYERIRRHHEDELHRLHRERGQLAGDDTESEV